MKTVLGLLYVVSCVSLQKLQQRRRQRQQRPQQQQLPPQRRQLQLQLLSCVSRSVTLFKIIAVLVVAAEM